MLSVRKLKLDKKLSDGHKGFRCFLVARLTFRENNYSWRAHVLLPYCPISQRQFCCKILKQYLIERMNRRGWGPQMSLGPDLIMSLKKLQGSIFSERYEMSLRLG